VPETVATVHQRRVAHLERGDETGGERVEQAGSAWSGRPKCELAAPAARVMARYERVISGTGESRLACVG
jgi:hypothetical protein